MWTNKNILAQKLSITHRRACPGYVVSDFAGRQRVLFDRMMVAGRAKVDGLIKSDSFFTVDPVCLYRLILAPAAAVNYHVK